MHMPYIINFSNTANDEEHLNWGKNAKNLLNEFDIIYINLYKTIKNIKGNFTEASVIYFDDNSTIKDDRHKKQEVTKIYQKLFNGATLCDIYFSEGKLNPISKNILLINPFEIDHEQLQMCFDMWHEAHKHMAKQPGFIGVNFFKSLDIDSKFKFINMAEWENEEKILQAISDPFYELHREKAKSYKMYPSLYRHYKTLKTGD